MDRTTFLETVSERLETDEEAAADATRAVLTAVGERLSEDQATDLAAQLPDELGQPLSRGESGQRFSEEEFVSRVDQRLETLEVTGERAATTVIGVALEAVDERERAAVVDQFEHYGYDDLLADTDAAVDTQDRTPREY